MGSRKPSIRRRSLSKTALYLLPVPAAWFLFRHLEHTLQQFNGPARQLCRDPNHSCYDVPPFTHTLLNRIVCVLVHFCSQAMNDPVSMPVTITLLGAATSVYAITSVEGARHGGLLALLPILMITAGNVIGTGIIIPLLWIPVYGLFAKRHTFIPTRRVVGIAFALLLGQCLPPALMIAQGPRSRTQHNIIAAFQYFPLVYCFVEHALSRVLPKSRSSVRQSRDGVRALYVGLGSILMFVHYAIVIHMFYFDNKFSRLSQLWSVMTTHAFVKSGDAVTYMLVWDVVAVTASAAYWAWLEDGRKSALYLILASVIFGPGAGIAVYGWRRECRIAIQQEFQQELRRKSV
ncbi:hypothetical protein BJV82DRAFT_614401 [Fennellomyces sp. T-0311]|nr:hypothetical protein BJV82DRAFT_614401 [Fennellomyces sp. T-0311]